MDDQIEGIALGQGANKDQWLVRDLLMWHVKLKTFYPCDTAIYVRSVILVYLCKSICIFSYSLLFPHLWCLCFCRNYHIQINPSVCACIYMEVVF